MGHRTAPAAARRRRRWATVSFLALVVGLTVGARPAAASTFDLPIGDLAAEFHEVFGPELEDLIVLDELCSGSDATVSTAGTGSAGTIDITIARTYEAVVAGSTDVFVAELITLSGTYAGTSVTVTGSTTLTVNPLDSTCTPDTNDECEIIGANLVLTGALNAGNPLLMNALGDEIVLVGGNSDFDTVAFGSTCGALVAVDSGRITYTPLALQIPRSPSAQAADETAGTLAFSTSTPTAFDTIFYGALGNCAAPTEQVTTGGTRSFGPVSVSVTSNRPYRSPGGTDFRMVTSVGLTGRHLLGTATVEGTVVHTLTRTTGFGSCSTLGGACTVTSTGVEVSGPITATDASQFDTGDDLVLAGGNATGQTTVSGSGTDCAGMVAINGGSIAYSGWTFEGS